MYKKPLNYLLPTILIGLQSFAAENYSPEQLEDIISKSNTKKAPEICDSIDQKIDEAMIAITNNFWKKALKDINQSNVGPLNILKVDLGNDKLQTLFNYNVKSSYYAPNVHTGTDSFEFNLGLAYPFGTDVAASIGLGENRNVSYTRMYSTKCLSLIRLPYDPIKRLPINAQKALDLTEGELVTFSAPITFSLGVSTGNSNASAGLGLFKTADIEIHVFRMKENLVRVKLIAKKDRGFNFNVESGVDILSTSVKVMNLNISSNTTDSELMDYVFNLNDAAAQKAYEQVVAPKNIFRFNANDIKNKALVAFLGNSREVGTLMIDAEDLAKKSKENKNNIIRVMGSKSEVNANRVGVTMKFTSAIKFEEKSQYSDNNTEILSEDKKALHKFFSRTIENIENSRFLRFTSKNKYQSGSIFTTNDGKPLGFLLNRHSTKQTLTDLMKRSHSYNLKNSKLTSHYQNIDQKLNELQMHGQYLTREMFFVDAENFFKLKDHLNLSTIKGTLISILEDSAKNNFQLTSKPASDWVYDSKNKLAELHSRYLTYPDIWFKLSLNEKIEELKHLYSSEINTIIPQHLLKIADTQASREERRLAFNALIQTPLFNEIGITLLTKLIPDHLLNEIVIYEFLLESQNTSMEPVLIVFGNPEGKNYITTQNAIMTRNFSLEPGSNLRVYLKQNGEQKSLKEVLEEISFK